MLKWDVHCVRPECFPYDCGYFGNVLSGVDARLSNCNIKFVTTWSLDWVPIMGDDVVVLLIGDEMFQTPSYAGYVKAIFKTGGIIPFHPVDLFGQPFYSMLEILRASRNSARCLKRRSKTSHVDSACRKTIFGIPLGFLAPADENNVPIEQRKWDIFFAGEVSKARWNQPKFWPWSPKVWSRNRLAGLVRRLADRNPGITSHFISAAPEKSSAQLAPKDYARKLTLSPLEYSRQLVQSKVCLCPRGTFHETFRFIEGARAGCILISEPLPDLWYYKDHPAVLISDWNQLEVVLMEILRSSSRMRELHEKSLKWWKTKACEEAVSNYIVKTVSALNKNG